MGSPVSGRGGVDFTRLDSTQEFPLGLVEFDTAGGAWVYVEAGAALTAYLTYKRLADGKVGSATAQLDAVDDNAANFVAGCHVCWPQQAFTSGQFGWVRCGGLAIEGKVANGVGAGDKLYTSATAGVLQGTASAHYNIIGDVIAVDANASGGDAQATINVAGTEAILQAVVNA